jgi:MSHA biogenesis protein MshN
VPEAPDLELRAPAQPALEAQAPITQAEAAFRHGLDQYRKQHAAEAEQAWRGALELEPAHELARRALANLLISRGDREGAERLLADGLKDHPDQLQVALALAQIQVGRGSWRDALKTLEASLPYAQDNAIYLAATAELKARAGQHAEAARLFEAALRIAPDNPEWTIALGLALQADGRSDQARDVLRQARNLKSLDALQRELIERKLRQLGG